MNKKFFAIFIIILIVLLLVAGGFWYYQKNKKIEPVIEPKMEIKKIVDDIVVSPTTSSDNNSIWFFSPTAHLFRVDLDGNNLTEYPLPAFDLSKGLTEVLWPQKGSDFITVFVSQLGETKGYYNSKDQKYLTFPGNIKKIDWLPDDKRVVYVWQSTDKKSQQLMVANADTTGFKKLKDLYWPDLVVKASPSGGHALMWRSQIEGDVNKIYLADLQTGETKTIIDQGKNLAAKWLNLDDQFIFTAVSDKAYPKLYLYNLTTQLQTDLNLNTTLEKTTVDKYGKFLYAAVPKEDKTGDYFIKINLSNGKQEIYFEPNEEVRVKELFFLGNSLYFTSVKDGKLYYLSE